MDLRKTPFYQKHLEHNAKIVDFSGWALPVEYASMLKEAKAARLTCGLFDASHMGEIRISGPKALDFLQRLTPNDVSRLAVGQMQYNLFTNQSGGVIDDLMICRLPDSFYCVVNASNKDKVFAWLLKNQQAGARIVDESDNTALLSLQGPNSARIIEEVFGQSVRDFKYMHVRSQILDKRPVIISRSGYTGEDGFELYFSERDGGFWWDKILSCGRQRGLQLCGLGSRDILRIEAGYPLYGHELSDEISPFEANLNWVVNGNKDFIGKAAMLEVKNNGVERLRVGFVMQDRAVPRQGYPICSRDKMIGEITSGTYSPNLDKFVGMAYVDVSFSQPGSQLSVQVRDRFYNARVERFPFVPIRTLREKSLKTA